MQKISTLHLTASEKYLGVSLLLTGHKEGHTYARFVTLTSVSFFKPSYSHIADHEDSETPFNDTSYTQRLTQIINQILKTSWAWRFIFVVVCT